MVIGSRSYNNDTITSQRCDSTCSHSSAHSTALEMYGLVFNILILKSNRCDRYNWFASMSNGRLTLRK